MSSDHLENPVRPAADRFLVLLKTRGPQTAADLGKATGVTGEAARQQLVAAGGRRAGRGDGGAARRRAVRPRCGRLTEAGNARFPDAHAELTAQLIRSIRSQLGEEALDRLIDARAAESQGGLRGGAGGRGRPGREGGPAGRGADARGVHGGVAGGGRGVCAGREPLPDLRGGDGLPGVLPGRTGDVPRGAGAGRFGRADRAHRQRRPALCLSGVTECHRTGASPEARQAPRVSGANFFSHPRGG